MQEYDKLEYNKKGTRIWKRKIQGYKKKGKRI